MSHTIRRFLFPLSITALIVFGLWYFLGVRTPESPHRANPDIEERTTTIFHDENALFSYVKKFGPKKTVERLNELTILYGSCHDVAHETGRFAYELLEDQAFKECSAECHSGCYHGATEAYFKEHGTANLTANLQTLCSSELNSFFSHQCFHGIGHGLMAWANYDLFEALDACDLLPDRQDSCWTGVFMENIVGGLSADEGHFTQFLSEDPAYPCTNEDLEDKYKPSCYFLQTSRMMQLFNNDFKKIADACAAAPAAYRISCFGSMGRDVGGTNRTNAAASIASCGNAPYGPYRIACLEGAAQDSFWDATGQDAALNFCTLLSDTAEKDACYRIIFGRAPDVFAGTQGHTAFCDKAEPAYQDQCRTYIQ